MTDATRAMIYHNNVDLQKACGAQIVVAAVKTLDGLTREDYAYRLIKEWGVGDKTGNNGAVLVLAIDEDDYYLTTGTGMERHLDAAALAAGSAVAAWAAAAEPGAADAER